MTAPIIENNYTGDGSTVLFSFTFEYIEATDIEVSIDNVTIATTEYSLANSTTIEFNTAPATGTAVRIYRNTTVNEPKATFFPGSAIRAQDLNDNFEQILFVTQEADAISERAETAADAAQTATTTAQAAAASANTAGAAAQASATAAQASATAAQTSATAAAADASQASTDAASAVATANTASTNASNAVTTANAASALISTAVLADGTRAMSGDLNVDSNKVVNLANPTAGGDAVNKSFADANYQPLDAELTELATMQNTTASALADLTQAEVLVLDGATLSTAELNTLDGITATTSELNTLDGITSTVGELNVLDGVTATTTELNITDGLTASTAELNQLDGKTISNVLTPANNNDIPTSSAVNTYVSGLLNALGGFVAIANESSFPTTNPDPSDNAGTVVSITDAGGLVVDSSGNSTSGTTTGNSTVTITGFPSSLHSTTLGNDLGLQVQTTSTLNTYTYHKLIAKESDVVRLSDDINDFNERYRVSASAPTTDLDAGDLWFDTTAGKMKVYDANDSAWEEVQSVGNFFINTLSSSSGTGGGSATFNGSAYRFTLSNAGANAQQMLVSVNGVVQKPNSGTSQPSEGFAIDTNDIIFAAAPASSASYFIVTIGSSVNIGQPSNNTVDTSELVDGAVTNAKVSSSAAIAGSKISPNFGSQNVVTTGSANAGSSSFSGTSLNAYSTSSTPNAGTIQARNHGTGGSLFVGFNSGGSDVVRLLSTGGAYFANNVGIGTTSPNGKFVVSNSGAESFEFYPADASNVNKINYYNRSGSVYCDAVQNAASHQFQIQGTEKIRIDSSGRLLVGTTTEGGVDADNLTIADSGNCGLTIRSGSTNSGQIYFSDATSGSAENDGFIVYNQSGRFMQLGTAQAERMRIGSSGSIGVNTTTLPNYSGYTTIRVNNNTNGGVFEVSNNNVIKGQIFYDGTVTRVRSNLNTDLTLDTHDTERVRITSNGYVGIGASPSYQLDVTGTANNGSVVSRVRNASQQTGALTLHQIAAGSSTLRYINNLISYSGQYYQQNGSGINTYYRDFDTHILRDSAGNEYMRLSSGGRLYIGSTGPTSNNSVRVNMSFTGGGTEYGMCMNAGSLNSGTKYITFDISTTNYGSIGWNGSAIQYYTSSDYRLKENIVSLEGGIERLKLLQPRRFNFTHNRDMTVDGFVAHEAQVAVPEAVSGTHNEVDSDGNPVYQNIDQSKFVPLLTAALQEAIAKIETLETQNASLEARLTALEGGS